MGRRAAHHAEHPSRACANHITRKLYRYFAADYPSGREEIDKPAQGVMREMASVFLGAKYAVKPVLAGEVFSEEWRDLVGRRAGMRSRCYDSASLYGTADAGVLGTETPLSVWPLEATPESAFSTSSIITTQGDIASTSRSA